MALNKPPYYNHPRNDIISHIPNNVKKILDVGCGGGLICEPLAKLGGNITGIDFIKENIKIAKNHAKIIDEKKEGKDIASTETNNINLIYYKNMNIL